MTPKAQKLIEAINNLPGICQDGKTTIKKLVSIIIDEDLDGYKPPLDVDKTYVLKSRTGQWIAILPAHKDQAILVNYDGRRINENLHYSREEVNEYVRRGFWTVKTII